MSRGYLLNINLNSVDPSAYHGWDGQLNNTHLDSLSFQKRLTGRLNHNYDCIQLADEQATISNTILAIREIATNAAADDIVIITYSGHGAVDSSSSYLEQHLMSDQAWCLYDGLLKDNHIHKLLSLFKKGTRVVLFSFCCHSGSMYKSGFFSMAPEGWEPKYMPKALESKVQPSSEIDVTLQKIGCKQDVICNLKYFGSCRESQFSYDTPKGDAGCVAWWQAYDRDPKRAYVLIFRDIFKQGLVPDFQTPVYQNLSKNSVFNNEYAFKI